MAKIQPINSIDTLEIYRVLNSNKLTEAQKIEFINKHASDIKNLAKQEITKSEFQQLMANRPLIRFRPFKNSFTKKGDDIILAQSLNINKKDINKYINNIINTNFDIQNAQKADEIEKLKTYVYRHGTKSQVVAFLEYELSDVALTLQKLYKTLDYNSGGLASYFMRPIHKMDNTTMRKLYQVIDKSLKASYNQGYIDEATLNSASKTALIKIYEIQNNSKFIRACEIYKDLT